MLLLDLRLGDSAGHLPFCFGNRSFLRLFEADSSLVRQAEHKILE